MKKGERFELDFFKSRKAIKSEAKNSIQNFYDVFVPLTLLGALFVGVPVGIAFLFTNLIVQICLWVFAGIMLHMVVFGFHKASLVLANDGKASISNLFSIFSKKFFKNFFFGLNFLILMALCSSLIAVPILLRAQLQSWLYINLIVVSFIPTLFFVIAHWPFYYVLIENPTLSNGQIMKMSRELTKQKRWDSVVMRLSFLFLDILSLPTALIAQLWIMPYKYQCFAVFYNDLKSEI